MNSSSVSLTISELREMFARFGIPQQIVSDQLTSANFAEFMSSRTASYYPLSNGTAKCLVQALKAGYQVVFSWVGFSQPSSCVTKQLYVPLPE